MTTVVDLSTVITASLYLLMYKSIMLLFYQLSSEILLNSPIIPEIILRKKPIFNLKCMQTNYTVHNIRNAYVP